MPDIPPPHSNLLRRDFLRLTAAGAAAGTAGSALSAFPAYARSTNGTDSIDYTARKTFDDWDRLFQEGGPGAAA